MGIPDRLFIVEDETIIAMMLTRGLRRIGFRVVGSFTSGEKALAAFVDERPDAVIMDINLNGEMTGIEVAGRMRGIAPVPVILITGYPEEYAAASTAEADVSRILYKPVTPDRIAETLREVLA